MARTLSLDLRVIGNKFHLVLNDLLHGIFFYQPNGLKDSGVLERSVAGREGAGFATFLNYSVVTLALSPGVSCLMDVSSNCR